MQKRVFIVIEALSTYTFTLKNTTLFSLIESLLLSIGHYTLFPYQLIIIPYNTYHRCNYVIKCEIILFKSSFPSRLYFLQVRRNFTCFLLLCSHCVMQSLAQNRRSTLFVEWINIFLKMSVISNKKNEKEIRGIGIRK